MKIPHHVVVCSISSLGLTLCGMTCHTVRRDLACLGVCGRLPSVLLRLLHDRSRQLSLCGSGQQYLCEVPQARRTHPRRRVEGGSVLLRRGRQRILTIARMLRVWAGTGNVVGSNRGLRVIVGHAHQTLCLMWLQKPGQPSRSNKLSLNPACVAYAIRDKARRRIPLLVFAYARVALAALGQTSAFTAQHVGPAYRLACVISSQTAAKRRTCVMLVCWSGRNEFVCVAGTARGRADVFNAVVLFRLPEVTRADFAQNASLLGPRAMESPLRRQSASTAATEVSKWIPFAVRTRQIVAQL